MPSFDTNDTYQKVRAVIAEKLNTPAETIKDESTFHDLGADSLDMVEIVMQLEELFGIEINDQEAESLETVAQVVEYVHKARTK